MCELTNLNQLYSQCPLDFWIFYEYLICWLSLWTDTMHQLLSFKNKFPNYFAFAFEHFLLIFGPADLMWMLIMIIYLI